MGGELAKFGVLWHKTLLRVFSCALKPLMAWTCHVDWLASALKDPQDGLAWSRLVCPFFVVLLVSKCNTSSKAACCPHTVTLACPNLKKRDFLVTRLGNTPTQPKTLFKIRIYAVRREYLNALEDESPLQLLVSFMMLTWKLEFKNGRGCKWAFDAEGNVFLGLKL